MKIRQAHMKDVDVMHKLITHYADQGLMLPRNINVLYQTLRDFVIIEEDEEIKGIGSLHILWHDLAEIRSLAIAPNKLHNGLGAKIVAYLLEEARTIGLKKVFTLTYQPVFFEKNGFHIIPKEELPQKIWQECVHCIKFPNCDEIALIIDINVSNLSSR